MGQVNFEIYRRHSLFGPIKPETIHDPNWLGARIDVIKSSLAAEYPTLTGPTLVQRLGQQAVGFRLKLTFEEPRSIGALLDSQIDQLSDHCLQQVIGKLPRGIRVYGSITPIDAQGNEVSPNNTRPDIVSALQITFLLKPGK